MAEFGLISGLAYKHNFEADMQRSLQLKGLERQYEQDARNRQKLLVGDIKFGVALNPYDKKQLDTLYEKLYVELGDFLVENPDVETDPLAWIKLTNIKNKFLDNEPVRRSMRVAEDRENMINFISENPLHADTKKMKEQLLGYDRYSNAETGGSSTENPEDRVEFTFTQPGSGIDLIKAFNEAGKSVNHDGMETSNFRSRQYVTNHAMMLKAEQINIDTGEFGLSVNLQWKSMEEKGQSGDFKDKIDYIYHSLLTSKQRDLYANIPGRGGVGGIDGKQKIDLFKERMNVAMLSALETGVGRAIEANPEGLERILSDSSGRISLTGIEIVNPHFPDSKNTNIDETKAEVSFENSYFRFTENPDPKEDGIMQASITLSMLQTDFEDVYKEDVFDNPNFFSGWYGKTETRKDFKVISIPGQPNIQELRSFENEDGKKMVKFIVWKVINPLNADVHNEYNFSVPTGTTPFNR